MGVHRVKVTKYRGSPKHAPHGTWAYPSLAKRLKPPATGGYAWGLRVFVLARLHLFRQLAGCAESGTFVFCDLGPRQQLPVLGAIHASCAAPAQPEISVPRLPYVYI